MRRNTWTRKTLPPHQILRWRQAHGISQEEMESYLGLAEKSRSAGVTVRNWEEGKSRPLGFLADALQELNNWVPLKRTPPLDNHPEHIIRWREKHGLAQTDLGAILYVSSQTISNWEGGRRGFAPYLPLALAYLDSHPEELRRRLGVGSWEHGDMMG